MNFLGLVKGGHIGYLEMRVLTGASLSREMFEAGKDSLLPVGEDKGFGVPINQLGGGSEGTAVAGNQAFGVEVEVHNRGQIEVDPAAPEILSHCFCGLGSRSRIIPLPEGFRTRRLVKSSSGSKPGHDPPFLVDRD